MSMYLSEPIEFGGEMTTRGRIIADMQKQGASQAQIDRLLQGLDKGRAIARAQRKEPA